jgi:3-oxoacyl-[acyl-carrier protein] reductase
VIPEPFDLSGRDALVTGAASGIGRATAIRLAGAGARVVCADINESAAQETAAKITADGGNASAVRLDVTDRANVDEVFAAVPELAILGNVAGIISNARVADLSATELDRIFAVNVKGVLFCAQAALRAMRALGRGSIINVASAVIDSPGANTAAYAMSKAAVAQLTKAMAAELGADGIRVNAVAPGLTETSMISRHYTDAEGNQDDAKRDEYLGRIREKSPLGLIGEPEDIAMAIWFLAADASRFMTGQILRPNGGVAMPW